MDALRKRTMPTVPGSEQALHAATETHNWVIVTLVFLIVAILTAFAAVGLFGGRYVLGRLAEQDRYIQDTLVVALKECTAQISSNTEALRDYSATSRDVIARLEGRPCQWAEVRDGRIVLREQPVMET